MEMIMSRYVGTGKTGMWWNNEIKAAVRRKEAAWKDGVGS